MAYKDIDEVMAARGRRTKVPSLADVVSGGDDNLGGDIDRTWSALL
jgi:hypothetical protein